MINEAVLSAWPVDRLALDVRLLVAAAQEGKLGKAQLQLRLVADRGDSVTVQVAEGTAPAEPGALLYIQGRGTFRQVRSERWPGGRVLLTLAAWPRR
jgi:hypothetical protein